MRRLSEDASLDARSCVLDKRTMRRLSEDANLDVRSSVLDKKEMRRLSEDANLDARSCVLDKRTMRRLSEDANLDARSCVLDKRTMRRLSKDANHDVRNSVLDKKAMRRLSEDENLYDWSTGQSDNIDNKRYTQKWIQFLASKKLYIMMHCILGLSLKAALSYFSGTLSSYEKRFKLPSRTTGMISGLFEIGGALSVALLAYLGGKGRKIQWLSGSMVASGIACCLMSFPHFIFGPGTTQLNTTANSSFGNQILCGSSNNNEENCFLNNEANIAVFITGFSYLTYGAFFIAFNALSIAYIDENVLKNKFPFIYSMCTCISYIGPSVGYLLASYASSFYIDLEMQPDFTQSDPRWIGAWYLGWIPIGLLITFIGLGIGKFPEVLPREARRRRHREIDTKPPREISFNDFFNTINNFTKNKILMYNTFSTAFYFFGLTGFLSFLPKYIEAQYLQPASRASFILGTTSVLCTAFGVFLSGIIISRYKPSAKALATWNVFTESLDVIGHLIFIFLGCHTIELQGFEKRAEKRLDLVQSCNSHCDCPLNTPYSPVCPYNQKAIFYSPCHAGCSTFDIYNSTKVFSNCSCVDEMNEVSASLCFFGCNFNFNIFLTILCIQKLLSACGKTGNAIIQFRSVSTQDKALSIAFSEIITIFVALFPSPIIFGFILGLSFGLFMYKILLPNFRFLVSCLGLHMWGKRKLLALRWREFSNESPPPVSLILATLLDVGVMIHSNSLRIYDEQENFEQNDLIVRRISLSDPEKMILK